MPKVAISIFIILILGIGLYLLWIKEKETQFKLEETMIEKTETKLESIPEEVEKTVSIITVYDNYQADPRLKTGWGFSCLIKIRNKSVLFDTGADSQTLLSNMEKMEIDPKDIDIIVLSHIHGDHIGGLEGFLKRNGNVIVYIPVSFPDSLRQKIKSYGGEYIDVKNSMEISEGVYSTGEMGAWIKEQSLIVNTEKGLILITGCAHPGVVNIIEKAKEMFPKENVYLVVGGFHLAGASDTELKSIINDFRKLDVQKVAPCHCSGDRCRELFKEEYSEDFIENGVGKIIEI